MVPTKGPFVLLEALGLLRAEGIKFRAVLAGPAMHKGFSQEFSEACSRHSLDGDVTWIGPCYGEAKERNFANADVFVFPSYYPPEGLPLVLLEAMSYGLPMVATRHAAIPDIIVEGKTGFLVPVRDPESLAAKLRILLMDRELRLRMGKSARERYLEKYTVATFENRLSTILHEFAVGVSSSETASQC
jgi:glycosyltransferase involved in cell wall biosynthesis